MRGCVDAIAQKGGEISSLARLLPTYTGADSPSGNDPRGHEATSEFLAIAKAYEASKKDGAAAAGDGGRRRGAAQSDPGKTARGRPDRPGRPRILAAGPTRVRS